MDSLISKKNPIQSTDAIKLADEFVNELERLTSKTKKGGRRRKRNNKKTAKNTRI